MPYFSIVILALSWGSSKRVASVQLLILSKQEQDDEEEEEEQ
jgi:hypothetical protein